MSSIRRKKKSHGSRSRSQSLTSEMLDRLDEKDETNSQDPKYEVKYSKIMGRYIVAKKHIRPGQLILSEDPLVVGPCNGCKIECIGCYKQLVDEIISRCNNCGWPICSQTCYGIKKRLGHSEIECTILQECKSASYLNYRNPESLRIHFNAIVPLRCLILKTTDPSAYDILMNMKSHDRIRKDIPELWNANQINVVDRIIKDWGLTEFNGNEIHKICGVLEVNSFEIGHQGINIRGLYPTAFLLSHDCVPNTNHTDCGPDYTLNIRASTEIAQGHAITLSYAYTLQNTPKRRELLLESKFFECHCNRCCDPTELGGFSGALICPKCNNGLVLSDKPLDFESSWSCNNVGECIGYSISANSMKLLINRITQEHENIDSNDINSLEMFLHKYRNVLHPTHYLCLNSKISLSQLYGKIDGYLIYEMTDDLLIRKRDICREILSVFNVIEPGYTRIRGVTLYEIHAPLMILLTRGLESGQMSKTELKARLKEVVQYLNEAKIILGFEPPDSPEGVMGQASKDALMQIKDWEKIVGKIR